MFKIADRVRFTKHIEPYRAFRKGIAYWRDLFDAHESGEQQVIAGIENPDPGNGEYECSYYLRSLRHPIAERFLELAPQPNEVILEKD